MFSVNLPCAEEKPDIGTGCDCLPPLLSGSGWLLLAVVCDGWPEGAEADGGGPLLPIAGGGCASPAPGVENGDGCRGWPGVGAGAPSWVSALLRVGAFMCPLAALPPCGAVVAPPSGLAAVGGFMFASAFRLRLASVLMPTCALTSA